MFGDQDVRLVMHTQGTILRVYGPLARWIGDVGPAGIEHRLNGDEETRWEPTQVEGVPRPRARAA